MRAVDVVTGWLASDRAVMPREVVYPVGDSPEEIREYNWKHLVTRDLLELRNIATVAELIIGCAASRHESRGLHSTIDYPATSDRFSTDTVVKRGVLPHLRGR